jgi:hypothetical protein
MSWATDPLLVYDGPAVFSMPVFTSPYPPRPPVLCERKSPGDPRCPACRSSRRGYCAEHKDFHYVTSATAGVA